MHLLLVGNDTVLISASRGGDTCSTKCPLVYLWFCRNLL